MSAPTVTRWVYDFTEGSREMRDLLGGKGANIAEMTRVLGPDLVPAGFTITTEAARPARRASTTPSTKRWSGSRSRPASGSPTRRTRSWSPCAAARVTRCRA